MLSATERRVMAQAATAFARAMTWRIVAQRLAAQDSLLIAAENALRTRFASGDARYVDVLRLRTERLHVQTESAQATTNAQMNVIALTALLANDSLAQATLPILLDSATASRPFDASPRGITAPWAALPAAPPLDTLVALTTEVRMAGARIDRAEALRTLTHAQQQPAISGTLGLQRIGPGEGNGANLGPVLAAGITLPFTAGRANRTATQAADRDVAAAEAARVATNATIHATVAASRERYEATRHRVVTYDATLLRAAREERESALAAYRTGELSLLELLDFERALSRAEIDRARTRLDAVTALCDLLSGTPTQDLSRPLSSIGDDRESDDR
jgi:outer membrane protein TolC